jgi:hypothetical protein
VEAVHADEHRTRHGGDHPLGERGLARARLAGDAEQREPRPVGEVTRSGQRGAVVEPQRPGL